MMKIYEPFNIAASYRRPVDAAGNFKATTIYEFMIAAPLIINGQQTSGSREKDAICCDDSVENMKTIFNFMIQN